MPAVGQHRGARHSHGAGLIEGHSLPAQACKLPKQTEVTILYISHPLNRESQHWHLAFKQPTKKCPIFPPCFPYFKLQGGKFLLWGQKLSGSPSLYVFLLDIHCIFLPSKHCSLEKEGDSRWRFQSNDCGNCSLFHDGLCCRYSAGVWCSLQSVTTTWQCTSTNLYPPGLPLSLKHKYIFGLGRIKS